MHLSPDDVAELDRRITAILDEYAETDAERPGQPLLGGIFILHRLAEPAADDPQQAIGSASSNLGEGQRFVSRRTDAHS